ncbi:MAG TPA: hypothetical protein VGS01_01710 [Candidatus Limnocylindria bacterium]|nr:hypothetical protein [Candidatus Limnocylindria bacterium]
MLDSVLPIYEVREYRDIAIEASPETAVAAALALRAGTDPVVATLFWLRGIPGGELRLKEFFPRLGLKSVVSTDRAFVGVGELLGVRIAFGIWAEARGDGGALLATETRVHAAHDAARRRFRLYWLVVGPFSALIRRRWLSAARRAAESRG